MMNDLNKEIKSLREQLRNQEKLASLGMLSAGIAHEIQNPLNFVINFSKLSHKLLEDMEELLGENEGALTKESSDELSEIMSDLCDNMRKIEENGSRASDIIKGILLYSRGKENEHVPTDIKRLVKEYVWLSFHAVRANNKNFNVAIQEYYDENVPNLDLIPQDFSRAIINLMNNACYAVYEKSKNSTGEAYQPVIKVELTKESDQVRLVIEDNGTGIPEDVVRSLFTPFFTTKPIGEGTGLGLSITKTIIEENHNGTIEVETSLNEFTRFTIMLPINNVYKT